MNGFYIAVDDPNQKDRLSQSLDDISMLSTPRHKSTDWRQTICRDEQNTARFFDNVYDLSLPNPKGFKNSTEYCNRDPRDNSANKSSHANHPDAMVVDRSNQERNQINSCHLKRIDTASVASETEILHEALLENCVFLQSSGSVTQAASPMSVMYFIMSSQRTVICCWSMVIAVFVLVTVVVLVTILVFELDVDYPLVREIRLLPEVQVFKQMRYDLVRKKFFNIFGWTFRLTIVCSVRLLTEWMVSSCHSELQIYVIRSWDEYSSLNEYWTEVIKWI